MAAGCGLPRISAPPPSPGSTADKADAVMRVVRDFMELAHLKAVIVRVTRDGQKVVTEAVGDAMTGVPATPDMHFRNSAVAISHVSTLPLKLAEQKKVSLDDRLSKWLLPNADRITLGQLAQMTSGYPDYVIGNDAFSTGL
jgi:CubicO group peptidase (beta-lactamase class C family)